MTGEEMRDMVKECGLDWHSGYVPLFDGDPTNRYAVLIEAVAAAEREECAQIADQWTTDEQRKLGNGGPAAAIRARGEK